MTLELTFLLYSIILTFALILVPATVAVLDNGLMTQAGARDHLPEPSVFLKRAIRLRDNMLENMVLFAALVLVAHAANVSNAMTVLGAQLFFGARIVHAVIYLAGWPLVRPAAWFVGVVGMILIALQLL